MRKLLWIIVALVACIPSLQAQEDYTAQAMRSADRLDYMLNQFYSKKLVNPSAEQLRAMNRYGFEPNEVPSYHPRIIEQRLKELCTVIPMDFNPITHAYINVYVNQRRSTVQRLLGRQHIFFPYIEEVLLREGLPMELKYVAVIESALTPRAQSWAAAVGLWQFIHGTASLYKMKMNSYVDERQDPFKATELAIAHFKDLYSIYGDWLLCIAAYNCGPGNVNRAIRLSGGRTSFWEIKRYLPSETAAYVPLFIAACYAMNYAPEHNIYPIYDTFTYPQTYIKIVNQRVTLAKVAEVTGMDLNELKEMNPELRLAVVPQSPEPYNLRVPDWVAAKVLNDPIAFYKSIGIKEDPMTFPVNEQALRAAGVEQQELAPHTPIPDGSTLIYHQLKGRQTVAYVAKLYNVTEKAVVDWNHMWGYYPRAGEWLRVYVDPNAQLPDPNAVGELDVQITPNVKTTDVVATGVPTVNSGGYGRTFPTANTPPGDLPEFHVVGSGDTLYKICQKYQHGLTVAKLLQLNGIAEKDPLHLGQKIRLQ